MDIIFSYILNIRNIRSIRSSADTPPRSRRRRRPRPAPLSLEADTQTDESGSDQSSLKSSSLSPMSSPTMSPARARPAPLSPRSPRSPCSCVPLSSYKEAPRSPGVVRSTRCSPWMSPSPRSPSPYHSPGPSPRSPRQPFFPSPTYSPVYSPRSPSSMSRSPSPRPSHHAISLGHQHQDNLSFLASRRKTSLASPRTLHNKTDKQVERRTSNFLELPGKVLSPFFESHFSSSRQALQPKMKNPFTFLILFSCFIFNSYVFFLFFTLFSFAQWQTMIRSDVSAACQSRDITRGCRRSSTVSDHSRSAKDESSNTETPSPAEGQGPPPPPTHHGKGPKYFRQKGHLFKEKNKLNNVYYVY